MNVKILHLSDLHLGKRVFEYSMLEEQRAVLSQALDMAKRADVTVIAGDVYDRPVPPAEAVTLFSAFLTDMNRQKSPVVMISGNHDSAERVAYLSGLLDANGVYVSPVYDGNVRRVTFEDEFGAVNLYLLPFVKPSHVRAALEDDAIEGYTAAMRAAIAQMDVDEHARNVLVAHQFVTGAATSDSEEVSVGGLDGIDASVFAPFDYVALGHLHRAQSLADGRVWYSGSPVCYSFSECGQEKCALLVELGQKGAVRVERLPFTPVHRMAKRRGTFDELYRMENACADYVQVTLTDEDDVPDAAAKLAQIYPNLMQVLYDNARTNARQADFSGLSVQRREPLELFDEFYAKQNGAGLSDEQRALLRAVMEPIWEDER